MIIFIIFISILMTTGIETNKSINLYRKLTKKKYKFRIKYN